MKAARTSIEVDTGCGSAVRTNAAHTCFKYPSSRGPRRCPQRRGDVVRWDRCCCEAVRSVALAQSLVRYGPMRLIVDPGQAIYLSCSAPQAQSGVLVSDLMVPQLPMTLWCELSNLRCVWHFDKYGQLPRRVHANALCLDLQIPFLRPCSLARSHAKRLPPFISLVFGSRPFETRCAGDESLTTSLAYLTRRSIA